MPGDPALLNLRQRPHPLPGSRWLEGDAADPGIVLPTAWTDEFAPVPPRFRLVVPPGGTSLTVPVTGAAHASLDGRSIATTNGAGTWTIDLTGETGRDLVITIDPAPGHAGGAALSGPITWQVGDGRASLGPWSDLGLGDYSGIVTYRQRVDLATPWDGSPLWLDLGDLRGSAAIRVNGEAAGTLVAAPFRVEITSHLQPEARSVEIEIDLANTLGPYMKATSPTPFVLSGQDISGLFGPVRLLTAG